MVCELDRKDGSIQFTLGVCREPSAASLAHAVDEGVDLVLAVAKVAALDEVGAALVPAAVGAGELERPEEVGGGLEVGADGEDLVDEVLNADDAVLAEHLLNLGVLADGDALAVDLGIAALVDELLDGLQVGEAVRNVGLDDAQHVDRGLVELDEDAVVDLQETEELEDLAHLGRDAVDTADADDESKLVLGGHVEVAGLASLALQADDIALRGAVLLDVLLSALEDLLALGLAQLGGGHGLLGLQGCNSLVALALEQQRLRRALGSGGRGGSSLGRGGSLGGGGSSSGLGRHGWLQRLPA
eukprot:m.30830 g.30830  ORF g.30830 m.30830 type:complete len:301 (+) comp10629_c0_seq1:140-1042(+)